MSRNPDKAQLIARLGQLAPRLVADGVLFHEAIAQRLGVNVTDLKCLNVLAELGPSTAGELAERTGLTTGAVTRMIDRLERAGYIHRHHDTADRRRVIIQPVQRRLAEVGKLYEGMAAAWAHVLFGYSVDRLEFLLELMERMRAVAQTEAAGLRARDSSATVGTEAAPG